MKQLHRAISLFFVITLMGLLPTQPIRAMAQNKANIAVGSWTIVNSPTSSNLSSVTMVSTNDGWAVGSGGTILRWNGSEWSTFLSPTTNNLNSATMVSANDGWAVGNSGIILRWDGNIWSIVTSPTTYNLSSVDMVSSTDGWAGINFPINQILHWDGDVWSIVSHPSNDEVFSVSMASVIDGWAVGWAGKLWHWNGSEWASPVTVPGDTRQLYSVKMISSNDGWAVGGTWIGSSNSPLFHWDGSTWSSYPSPTNHWLFSVDMASTTDGWAVGGYPSTGTILHWDGSTWVEVTCPITESLSSVSVVSANDSWAVGGNGKIIHYSVPSPTLTINYSTGKPDSFFTLSGSNFPSDSTATITVNGNTLGTVPTDSSGGLVFLLNTDQADEGRYIVTATVNPSASAIFVLDSIEPLRPQEGSGTIFNVPSGIAYTHIVYLPLILR